MSLGPAATVAVVRLEEDHLNLVIDTNDLALSLGHHSVLLPELEELTLRHPYCERFYDQLMVAQYRAGRTDAVVRAYSRLCGVLDLVVGLTPSPMIERRYVAILRHDSAMDPQRSGIPAGWSPVAT
jgi:DNA-binding SARP family transcriptional activator